LNALYTGYSASQANFSNLQNDLADTFWPGDSGSDLFASEFLTGIGTAIAIVAALAGPEASSLSAFASGLASGVVAALPSSTNNNLDAVET
jgi:hypothetical protein